jgi:hypothetical protein
MTELVPSFLAKLNRAEKHLADLDQAISEYGSLAEGSRPYTLRKRIEGHDKR